MTPFCQCTSSWTGADCTTATNVTIVSGGGSCSSISPPCSGSDHGLCDFNTQTCVCNSLNWAGAYCEIGKEEDLSRSVQLLFTLHSYLQWRYDSCLLWQWKVRCDIRSSSMCLRCLLDWIAMRSAYEIIPM